MAQLPQVPAIVAPTSLSALSPAVLPPVVTPFPESAAVTLPVASGDVPAQKVESSTVGNGSSGGMYLARYNDASIVLRGPAEETKKYKANFRKIGGKPNNFLSGGFGWIFSNSRQTEVQALLDGILAGTVQPLPSEPKGPRGPKGQKGTAGQSTMMMTPYGPMQMMPSAFPMMSPMGQMSSMSPMNPMGQMTPMGSVPNPYGFPMSVPHLPFGGGHSSHQTITYSGVFKPHIGMTAHVKGQNVDFNAKVVQVGTNPDGTVTSALLQVEHQGTQTFEAGLWNGRWALRAHPFDHTVYFKN